MLAFDAQEHTGLLHMVSRRGRLPQAHLSEPVPPGPWAARVGQSLSRAAAEIRRSIASSEWRAVIDGLRPVTTEI